MRKALTDEQLKRMRRVGAAWPFGESASIVARIDVAEARATAAEARAATATEQVSGLLRQQDAWDDRVREAEELAERYRSALERIARGWGGDYEARQYAEATLDGVERDEEFTAHTANLMT